MNDFWKMKRRRTVNFVAYLGAVMYILLLLLTLSANKFVLLTKCVSIPCTVVKIWLHNKVYFTSLIFFYRDKVADLVVSDTDSDFEAKPPKKQKVKAPASQGKWRR